MVRWHQGAPVAVLDYAALSLLWTFTTPTLWSIEKRISSARPKDAKP